ncbi:MAG: DUF2721 domain-containing protein [Candidatus Methylopumilus sp.]|jgi:hypothetical protein
MIFHTLPDIQSVSEAIHDAVAPVFLITGIGSILSVLVNRLGRAVDRARIINDMPLKEKKAYFDELSIIISRTTWIRRSIGLITLSALSVCISIGSLFVEVNLGLNLPNIVTIMFITAMSALILGLLCFLREVILASQEVIAPNRDR